MKQTIKVRLNTESIAAAIRQTKAYKKRLQKKADILRERIAYLIAKDASLVFNTATAGALIGEGAVTGHVDVRVEDQGTVTVIFFDGKDAIFMEFGAGVYGNGPVGTSPNPLGAALGYTIGSYGKGNGKKEVWGYYDEDHRLHITHGTPASMPIYRAVTAVAHDIIDIAREVFDD